MYKVTEIALAHLSFPASALLPPGWRGRGRRLRYRDVPAAGAERLELGLGVEREHEVAHLLLRLGELVPQPARLDLGRALAGLAPVEVGEQAAADAALGLKLALELAAQLERLVGPLGEPVPLPVQRGRLVLERSELADVVGPLRVELRRQQVRVLDPDRLDLLLRQCCRGVGPAGRRRRVERVVGRER